MPDSLFSHLEEIRGRAESPDIGLILYGLERMVRKSDDWQGWLGNGEDETATYEAVVETGKLRGDAARLVAAVDAVLKLADSARSVISFPPADCTNACGDGPCNCSGKFRSAGWDLDPTEIRRAVVRSLTGQEDIPR